MLSGGLELVADQAQVDQEDWKVEFRALRIELSFAAGRSSAVQGFGADREDELDCGFDFACVEGSLEQAELDGASVEHAVEVHRYVPG